MQNPFTPQAPSPPRRIETAADGERLLTQLAETLNALLQVVEQETELVRKGRLAQAAKLEPKKSQLAGQYYAAIERLKQNLAFLRAKLPDRLRELQRQLDASRPLLQLNLTVLATAHAVSEGIIRGVAGEIARKAAPQTYGVSGRPTAPVASAARPVTLSRVL